MQKEHDLNERKWNDLLGSKPDDFDDLPYWNSKLRHKLQRRKTKSDIIRPLRKYICGMLSEKELLHYHNVICLGKTEDEFDRFWREYHMLREYCQKNKVSFVNPTGNEYVYGQNINR